MEGDVITLQDIFLFDHSPGFDEDGPQPRHASRRPACARSSWRSSPTPTSRRPDALRPGRSAMTMRGSSCAVAAGGSSPARRSVGLVLAPAPAPRRRGRERPSTTSSRATATAPGRGLRRRRRRRRPTSAASPSTVRRQAASTRPPSRSPDTGEQSSARAVLAMDVSDSMARRAVQGREGRGQRVPRRRARRRLRRPRHVRRRRHRRAAADPGHGPRSGRRSTSLELEPAAPGCTTACPPPSTATGDEGAAQRPRALRRRGHSAATSTLEDVATAVEDADVKVDVVALAQNAGRHGAAATSRRRRPAGRCSPPTPTR